VAVAKALQARDERSYRFQPKEIPMTTSTITPTLAPAMQALKERLKEIWMAGDYSHFATRRPGVP